MSNNKLIIMKSFNVSDINLSDMNDAELQETNGGIAVAAVLLFFAISFLTGAIIEIVTHK
jgi:hypothetical protein